MTRARNISDVMLASAAKAIVSLVDAHLPRASLLRQVENLRTISAAVAVEVTKKAEDEGLGHIKLTNNVKHVHDMMWQPVYPQIGKVAQT